MARIEARIRINATPDVVYRALTDAKRLRVWFAEHAAVDFDARRYEFWGRYTLGNPGASGTHLIEVESDRSLSYSWRLDGLDTQVAIELSEDGDGTELALEHRGVDVERPLLVETFWSMALENLRAFLERGQPGIRFDYADVPQGNVEFSIEIEASPETVFDALIEPSQVERYMTRAQVRIEPEAGGRYDIGWGDHGPGKILDLVPGERLCYSWSTIDRRIGETMVTWQLEGSAGRTRLTLVHSGFAPDRVGLDFGMGWFDYLNRIKQMSEVGDSWTRPMVRVVSDRDVRNEALDIPAAGIQEAIAGAPSRVSRQRPR